MATPMLSIKITTVEADTPQQIQEELKDVFASMDESLRAWTRRAARGECGWVCSDCCGTHNAGMPDKCLHGQQFCTDINQRDRRNAWEEIFAAQRAQDFNDEAMYYYFRDVNNPFVIEKIGKIEVGSLTGKWLPRDSNSAEYVPFLIRVEE